MTAILTPPLISTREAAGDADLVSVLEHAVDSWGNVITAVLAQEQHKQLVGTGPISGMSLSNCNYQELQYSFQQQKKHIYGRVLPVFLCVMKIIVGKVEFLPPDYYSRL
jgi:hypothetical protein